MRLFFPVDGVVFMGLIFFFKCYWSELGYIAVIEAE